MTKLAIFSAFLLSLAFFGATIVGPFHFAGIQMDHHGATMSCPFMGVMTLCRMSVMEHLTQWQTMFAGSAPSRVLVSMFGILISMCAVGGAIARLVLAHQSRLKSQWYQISSFAFTSPTFLQEEFSQGVLNPKIY